MEKFKFLDDVAIADVCFEAYGATVSELFENAGLALMEVMADVSSISKIKYQKSNINIKNQKLEDLLFEFLAELVFLKDRDAVLFNKFKVNVFEKEREWNLEAECFGEKINPEKHHLRADVKAVTWHMFSLNKAEEGWKARVVVDV